MLLHHNPVHWFSESGLQTGSTNHLGLVRNADSQARPISRLSCELERGWPSVLLSPSPGSGALPWRDLPASVLAAEPAGRRRVGAGGGPTLGLWAGGGGTGLAGKGPGVRLPRPLTWDSRAAGGAGSDGPELCVLPGPGLHPTPLRQPPACSLYPRVCFRFVCFVL